MLSPLPEGEERGTEVEEMFSGLVGENFLEPMNECMKGCTDPFNGWLCFGDTAPRFRQPRAQKILTGDSGPSLLLAKGHGVV